VEEVDLFEVNEAFAMVSLLAMAGCQLPHDKVNVNGGACALGHPLGASGARILVTLIHALRERGLTRGVASLYRGRGGDGGRHRAGLICLRHRLELLVDPGGGGQIELADLLFIEPEPGRSGSDPLPVGFLVILAERQIEPQLALAGEQGGTNVLGQRNGAEQLVQRVPSTSTSSREKRPVMKAAVPALRAHGCGPAVRRTGPDDRHLIELGALAVPHWWRRSGRRSA
jgi:hypothetical protein